VDGQVTPMEPMGCTRDSGTVDPPFYLYTLRLTDRPSSGIVIGEGLGLLLPVLY
jgi:hypothetical protein